jgi:outer membrane protein
MNHNSASRRRIIAVAGIFFIIAAISAVSFAQQETAPPNQQQAVLASVSTLPLSPIEKAQKNGTAVPLSLKDVTKLALQNNLEIAIQDTNEIMSQQKILQAYGVYDPTLSIRIGTDSRKSANTNLATASSTASFSTTKNMTWNLTFNQSIKTGGTLQGTFNSGRQTSDQAFYTLNPNYTTSGQVTFTQPLLRNLRIDSNRGQIKLVNLDLQTSDSSFKQKVTDTISTIQGQYWDLVAAIEDYRIKRESVKLAQTTLANNIKKVQVGTLAPIEVTQAQSSLAQRELALYSSEETIIRRENDLRKSISNNRNAEIWAKIIVPTDKPDFKEYKIDMETAIDTALKNRPELEQIDIQVRKSDINMDMTRNSRKWQLDLQAVYGSNGAAGTPMFNNNSVPPAHIGGIGRAYNNLFTEGLNNWTLQATIGIPLRNRANDAQYAQQEITKRQTLMQRKSQEQSIQVEIRNYIQQLETNRKQVDTSKLNLKLAQEQLDGEEKRFNAGLSENYRVLEQQNNLASAENSALTALIGYKKAIISLQKAMYLLLESNEFEMAKGVSNNVPDVK